MQLTRGSEYAVRGLLFLAAHKKPEPVLLADIAKGIGAPMNYLSNLFQLMTRLKLVQSHRGAKRGYTLARPPGKITLREVLEGLEGPIALSSCLMDTGVCPAKPGCSLHDFWESLQAEVVRRLEGVTLGKLLKNHCQVGDCAAVE